jgi:uncharacterized protein (DUF488 family)
MTGTRPILTIGHSRHSWERFLDLLGEARVETLADIRSTPRSRFLPHFNQHQLAAALATRNVDYMFLGRELGGRPQNPALYTDGVADYEKMAASAEFRRGLERLMETAARRSVAAMCSEADPLACHRCLLVGRALAEHGADVRHILASGEIVAHTEVEDRLLSLEKMAGEDLLAHSRSERLAAAYRTRSRKAGYRAP